MNENDSVDQIFFEQIRRNSPEHHTPTVVSLSADIYDLRDGHHLSEHEPLQPIGINEPSLSLDLVLSSQHAEDVLIQFVDERNEIESMHYSDAHMHVQYRDGAVTEITAYMTDTTSAQIVMLAGGCLRAGVKQVRGKRTLF